MALDNNIRTYSITEIGEEITHLPEQFEQDADAVTITRKGKPYNIPQKNIEDSNGVTYTNTILLKSLILCYNADKI